MSYPPAVSLVGYSTLRWSGAGTYGGTVDVPTGVAEGDLLVVIAMHLPQFGPGVTPTDRFIDGTWTDAYVAPVSGSVLSRGFRTAGAGEPATYEIDFAPHGDFPDLTYEQDGPAGNCVMLAFRGVEGLEAAATTNHLYLSHPDGTAPETIPAPVLLGAIADQHSLAYPGYDPDATVSLASFDGRPPAPLVIVAYASTSSGLWFEGGGDTDTYHSEYQEQTCTWTTPTDESGAVVFSEVVDFATGPNLAVAWAANVPAEPGPVGNVVATPSAWAFAAPFTPGGFGPEQFLQVDMWGRLDAFYYPAPPDEPPPPTASGWFVGSPLSAA